MSVVNTKRSNFEPRIKVIGLGGSGCNTITRLNQLDIPGIELIAINTNRQDLIKSCVNETLLIGEELTQGFGAGGDVAVGLKAAELSYKDLINYIDNTDILFLTAGMGGGTGSGAIQIAARIARSLNILTIAIVTLPFSFESGLRSQTAAESTACLRPFIDTLITIPNDHLLTICSQETTLTKALAQADDLLINTIMGIKNLLTANGLINIDFSHISRLMKIQGGSMISSGKASGVNRVDDSLRNALENPLIKEIPLSEAKGLIVQFSGNITLDEIEKGSQFLREHGHSDAEIIPVVNHTFKDDDELEVLILATGIETLSLDLPLINNTRVFDDLATTKQNKYAETIIKETIVADERNDLDELYVPAFIRKGYNLINQ